MSPASVGTTALINLGSHSVRRQCCTSSSEYFPAVSKLLAFHMMTAGWLGIDKARSNFKYKDFDEVMEVESL